MEKSKYHSFSINLNYEDTETGEWHNVDYLPIYLENHPSIYARLMYKIGKKFIEWLNKNNKQFAVTLDGNYIERK